jgi:hypothetical protein
VQQTPQLPPVDITSKAQGNIPGDVVGEIMHHLAPVRQNITHHQLVEALNTPKRLQLFMPFHVFAVWVSLTAIHMQEVNLVLSALKNVSCQQ